MGQSEQDRAIVLRVTRFEERHQIVLGLTETYGRVSVLARNSIQSRRFGGSLGLFTLGKWDLVRKEKSNLWRLDGATCLAPFEGLRRGWDRLSTATFFIELLARVTPEHEACPELFRLAVNALDFLSEAPELRVQKPASLLNQEGASSFFRACAAIFGLKILQWSGSQPRLSQCLSCEQPLLDFIEDSKPLRMAITEGGWVCPICAEKAAHVAYQQTFQTREIYLPATLITLCLEALSKPIKVSFERLFCLIQSLPTQGSNQQGEKTSAHELALLDLLAWIEALLAYHLPTLAEDPLKSLRALHGLSLQNENFRHGTSNAIVSS